MSEQTARTVRIVGYTFVMVTGIVILALAGQSSLAAVLSLIFILGLIIVVFI